MESRVETILFLPGSGNGFQYRVHGRYLQIHQDVKGDAIMTGLEQLREWERQEEQHDFTEVCRVANKNLWLCDDGAP